MPSPMSPSAPRPLLAASRPRRSPPSHPLRSTVPGSPTPTASCTPPRGSSSRRTPRQARRAVRRGAGRCAASSTPAWRSTSPVSGTPPPPCSPASASRPRPDLLLALRRGDRAWPPLSPALAEAKRPLVRLRGRWVRVDPDLLARLLRCRSRRVTGMEALAVALTGTLHVDGEAHEFHPDAPLAEVTARLTATGTAEVGVPDGLRGALPAGPAVRGPARRTSGCPQHCPRRRCRPPAPDFPPCCRSTHRRAAGYGGLTWSRSQPTPPPVRRAGRGPRRAGLRRRRHPLGATGSPAGRCSCGSGRTGCGTG